MKMLSTGMAAGTELLPLSWQGRELQIEMQWVGVDAAASTMSATFAASINAASQPVVVFLHEGLGSVAMWREFPAQFCQAHGLRGLVYSRYGYGGSTPKPAEEKWTPDFMHRQAQEVLPALLDKLGIVRPWLFGHSDGGSIALLYAASFPDQVAGLTVVAPHIFVEEVGLNSIAAARQAYAVGDFRSRLARYHGDVDSAFRGWNDVWLSAAFREWNIEAELASINCPLQAIQGNEDEYGTLEQIRGIARRVPHTELVILPECGHSPHRDQPEALTRIAGNFIIRNAPERPG